MEDKISREEIYKELNARRNKLELDLIETGRDKTTKIQDIKRMGIITIHDNENEEKKQATLYVVEELDIKTDSITLKYHADEQLIGIEKDGQIAISTALNADIDDAETLIDNIESLKVRSEEINDDKDLKESEGIFSLTELEAEKDEEYAKTIGIDKKEIKAIAEIKEEKQKETEGEELDSKKVEKLNHLQEIKASTKVNNYQDMEQALGMQSVSKFVVVYSEDAAKLSETGKRNNSRYSMIAVMDDGRTISMDDKLEPNTAAGTNNNEGRIQTDRDEITRKESGEASIYNIKGTNKSFSFELGQYGEIQVYYGQMTRGIGENEGNVFNGSQIETDNVRMTSHRVRALEDPYEGVYHADQGTLETQKHLEHGDEEVSIENSDGVEQTKEECSNIYEQQIPGLSFEMTWINLADNTGIPLDEVIDEYTKKIDEGLTPDKAVLRMQEETDVDYDDERNKQSKSVDREPGDLLHEDRTFGPKY